MKKFELRQLIREEIRKVLKEEVFDIDQEFDAAPNTHSYEDVLGLVKDYEGTEDYISSFRSYFTPGKPIRKEDWVKWSQSIDDDPEAYAYLNWISLTDPSIFNKTGVGV